MARVDLFGPVHKGLRATLAGTAALAARTDFTRPEEAAELEAAARRLLGFLEEHAAQEDAVLMPELQRVAAELHADLQAEHARADGLQRELAQHLDRLAGASEAERVSLGRRIHERLWRLAAEHLRHMEREEAEANRVLWAHFEDEALRGFHARILGAIPPTRFAEWGGIILPSLSLPERAAMVAGLAANLPPAVFLEVTGPAREALGPAAWSAVTAAAAIPA